MADMHAFERQVAEEIQRFVGPVRRVDDAAIVAAIARAAQPRWWGLERVLRPATLIVAGTIVVLFASLLLVELAALRIDDDRALPGTAPTVAPTRSVVDEPSASASSTADRETRDDIVPGVSLVTEEFEPGVLRVVNDGIRDLSWQPVKPATDSYYYYRNGIGIGNDSIVWLLRPEGLLALGSEPTYPWDGARGRVPRSFAAGSRFDPAGELAGRLWFARDGLLSFQPGEAPGATWSEAGPADAVAVGPTDTVWVASVSVGGRVTISSSDDHGDSWRSHEFPGPNGYVSGLWASESGAWLLLEPQDDDVATDLTQLWHFDGSRWDQVDIPAIDYPSVADVGRDGTFWAWWYVRERDGAGNASMGPESPIVLARHDATGWTTFDAPEDVPLLGFLHDGSGFLAVAPDGSAWFNPRVNKDRSGTTACDGLARFDGVSLTRYLPTQCIYNLDVAPDGTVWVLAGADYWVEPGPVDTYVIPREVAMADA